MYKKKTRNLRRLSRVQRLSNVFQLAKVEGVGLMSKSCFLLLFFIVMVSTGDDISQPTRLYGGTKRKRPKGGLQRNVFFSR